MYTINIIGAALVSNLEVSKLNLIMGNHLRYDHGSIRFDTPPASGLRVFSPPPLPGV